MGGYCTQPVIPLASMCNWCLAGILWALQSCISQPAWGTGAGTLSCASPCQTLGQRKLQAFVWGWCGHCRPFLELPRGTKQQIYWDEGCGFGHSSVLTCSTFPLHAFHFLGALSTMKQVSASVCVVQLEVSLHRSLLLLRWIPC